jgi:hypothetical protein
MSTDSTSTTNKLQARHVVAIIIGVLTLFVQINQEAIFLDAAIAVALNVGVVYGIAAIVRVIKRKSSK